MGKPPTRLSSNRAPRSTMRSSQRRPTSIIPKGSSELPHGTLTAGCPVTSNGAVFWTISSARPRYSSSGAVGSGITVARIGTVGSTHETIRAAFKANEAFQKRMRESGVKEGSFDERGSIPLTEYRLFRVFSSNSGLRHTRIASCVSLPKKVHYRMLL